MPDYPVAYAHDAYRDLAQVIIGQLERRDADPIQVLIGQDAGGAPTCFHRRKEAMSDGSWSWVAVDDAGREVRSGVIHDEAPADAMTATAF